MRKMLIVANWKMHLNVSQSSVLVQHLHRTIKVHRDIETVLAPSMLALQPLSLQIDRRQFRLAAQNAYFVDDGAYTGEVSFSMLRDLVHYCLIGHSERRIYFNESLEMIRDKVAAAVRNDIVPILCVGETKNEREAGETRQVLHDQLTTALSNLTSREIEDVIIAYEPVWAISTFEGVLAKPHEIQSEIDFIRHQVEALYGDRAAQRLRVLYGGSVDDQIAHGYLELEGCDGALVGGASLNYVTFAAIVAAAERVQNERTKQKGPKE